MRKGGADHGHLYQRAGAGGDTGRPLAAGGRRNRSENLYKALKIVGGATTYIPKSESLIRPVRNRHIRKEFNGYNYLELSKKYGVTDRVIRMVCGPGFLEGQINLFEDEEKDSVS